jgi:hypothetical protein
MKWSNWMTRPPLDAVYFANRTWKHRVEQGLKRVRSNASDAPFIDGNVQIIREILMHADTGLRMVINIGADALLSFLSTGDYRNIYEEPVIGGKRHTPTPERITVDRLLGLEGLQTYFGAVALGGTGVRFYGEYCMVLKPSRVDAGTPVFDRDSYDLLLPPLAGWSASRTRRIVDALRGRWGDDLAEMLIMKMMPRLPGAQHLITVGNVSALVMSDQEFVEVHLAGKIQLADVEEIRQSPDEVAIESAILNRKRSRRSPTLVEIRWVEQRQRALSELAKQSMRYRIVTLHGKGYQWT